MWQTPPQNIDLFPTDIHVWKTNLNINTAQQNELWQLLSNDEKTRANRFRFPHLRVHYIAGRGALRQLCGRYLSVAPQDLVFTYGAQGKPLLSDFPDFSFNLSHSHGIAVFAFAHEMTLGIDVEFIDTTIDYEVIAPRFFSKNEADTLLALPKAERPPVFFNCWTRKEAFIKAKGGGLSIPLDQFEVTLLLEDTPRLLAIDWAPEEVSQWSIFSFSADEGYVGALMTDAVVRKIYTYVKN